jgi:hypothetical protein
MESDELKAAKRERDGVKERLILLRGGLLTTLTGPQLETDTTAMSTLQAEQQLEALERKVVRLETDVVAGT